MIVRLPIAISLLCALIQGELFAQTLRDSVRWRAIDSLTQGTLIKVRVFDAEYVGQFTSRTRHDLILDRSGHPLTVPVSEVTRLWEADGPAAKDGFIFGAIVGGVVGGILGAHFGGFMCESNCGAQKLYATAAVGLGGAVSVGLVGSVLGSFFVEWKQRFP